MPFPCGHGVPDIDPSYVVNLRAVRRYHIKSQDLLAILFPGPQGGVADAFEVQQQYQNKLLFCPLLRQRLQRGAYPWWKHPNCARYNGDNGCMILLPFCMPDINGGEPYDNMLEFFDDMSTNPTLTNLNPNLQRKLLYKMPNRGIGGPRGQVLLPSY